MSKKIRICSCCGKKFNLDKTRESYNEYFRDYDYGDDLEYDDAYDEDMCLSCAISDTGAALGEADEINEFRY